jgi:hypothetical protein
VLLIANAGTLAACEFGEITIPNSEPIVVVQAVMRPDQPRQWVLVEQTYTGVQPPDSGGTLIPGESPALPVTGATVTVRNLTHRADPCGLTAFVERPDAPFLPQNRGVYWGSDSCPTMRAGDTLELRVLTPRGTFVSGRTVVPGVAGFRLRVGDDQVSMPGPPLELNRDRDTLRAAAVAPQGRALQLEVRRPTVTGSSAPAFWIAVDSIAIAVPGDLPDILTGFQVDTSGIPDAFPPVFVAGATQLVTVGLADDAYFDFVRSGNIPPSGRGFINRLQGGMGVFGSMVAATSAVRVVSDLDDPREGTYRLSGTVLGVPIDVELELYVADAGRDSTAVTSFVDGQWYLGPIAASADGGFVGDTLTLVLEQVSSAARDSIATFIVRGATELGGATTISVLNAQETIVDSLSIVRPEPSSVQRP